MRLTPSPLVMSVVATGFLLTATPLGAQQFKIDVQSPQFGVRVVTDTPGGKVGQFGGLGDFVIDAPAMPGGRLIVKDGGNVGIGTAAPSYKLDVNGAINATSLFVNGVAVGAGGSQWASGVGGLISYTGGNVGIGTTSPAQSLEINGTTSLGPPGSTYGYSVENSESMYPTFAFNTHGTSYVAGVAGYGGIFQFKNSTGDLVYYSGSNVPAGTPHVNRPEFSIRRNGGVGIGTDSPQARLHVADLNLIVAPMLLVDGLLGSGGFVTVFQVNSRFGVGNLGLSVNNNGHVAIGGVGAAGGSQLCLNASSQIAFCSSSLRYKTNIASFAGGLDVVTRLRPISFTWKEDGTSDIGLAAEEVDQVEPRLTFRNSAGEIEGVKYNQLSAVFINAIKEQQAQIHQQQEQLQAQQRQIDALLRLLCSDHARAAACAATQGISPP